MNKKRLLLKVLFIIISIAIVSIILFYVYYFLKLNYDEEVTQRVTEDVIVVNDLIVSFYLVRTDSGYICFDTGFFNAFAEKGLQYNKINPDEVKYIFITHSDADHINGIKLFRKAKVFFPSEEKNMLDTKSQRFTFLPFYSNNFDIKKYFLLKDNDEITVCGKKIRCISLPGHTAGSMVYLVDSKYLFSGDAFRIKNGKIDVPFKKQFVMDIRQMRQSLKKIAHYNNINYIFSGHSGYTADFQFAVSDLK